MRKGSLFWGAALVLFGVVILLDNLGYLDALGINVWSLFWPAFLILLGMWILWGTIYGRRSMEGENVVIPLEGAGRAQVIIKHGAGRLNVNSGASPINLVEGTFVGGLDFTSRRDGDLQKVDMRVPPNLGWFFPWTWWTSGGIEWNVRLSKDLPMALEVNAGANDTHLNLTELRLTDLRLQTGASSTELSLPANAGYTRAEIESGAASVSVRIPQEVSARIRVKGGLSNINVDSHRFSRQGDVYQSPDYDTAANKVDLYVQTGVGSVVIR